MKFIVIRMQIGIKTMTGRIIMIDIEGDQTIALLKQKIKEQEGIPVRQQKLVLSGKNLEDGRLIRDCHTYAERDIHLIVRYTHG